MSPTPATSQCPRCQSIMTCNRNDITSCDCYTLTLSPDTIAHLQKTNWGCLCNNCLIHIEGLTQQAKSLSFPLHPSDLIEGTHYYLENGNWVFTELYHYLRGHCCKSGCRHCVYGF